jgi:Uma2 family endonuclease
MATVAERPIEIEREYFIDEETGEVLFTYRDLMEMETLGIIRGDRIIELLGGRIYQMTIKPPHAFAVDESSENLKDSLGKQAKVLSQRPLRLSNDMNDRNLPQPDVLVLKRKLYTDHPRVEDVYFLIEVSDSTLRKDRNQKLPLYAKAGIAEVWIINLIERQIEVYTNPVEGKYQRRTDYALEAEIPLTAFPNILAHWIPKEIHEVLDKLPPE